MKAIIVFGMLLPGLAIAADDEAAVRHAVQAFYTAFDEGFVKPVDFATDDWYHINPFGGIDRGLEATLKTVREVHTTFLKGVTDTPEDIAIRFASGDVAVATVTSTMSQYTRPDGVKGGLRNRFVPSSWLSAATAGSSCRITTRRSHPRQLDCWTTACGRQWGAEALLLAELSRPPMTQNDPLRTFKSKRPLY